MNNIYNSIAKAAKHFGASKVVLFGSRARGDNRERSDTDIAVYGIDKSDQAITDYNNVHLNSVRDGVIQRFEFCTELAWKTVREYLIEQGYVDINSPKSVMKTAFSDGLLTNENGWLEILESRNITSHVYDEKTAETIFESIKDVYTPLFSELIETLKK